LGKVGDGEGGIQGRGGAIEKGDCGLGGKIFIVGAGGSFRVDVGFEGNVGVKIDADVVAVGVQSQGNEQEQERVKRFWGVNEGEGGGERSQICGGD